MLRNLKPWHVYFGVGLALIPLFYAFASGGDMQYAIFVVITARRRSRFSTASGYTGPSCVCPGISWHPRSRAPSSATCSR